MTQQIDPAQLAAFRRAVRANIQREIGEERAEAEQTRAEVLAQLAAVMTEARQRGFAGQVWLFGSFAWGLPGERSDIDLIIEGDGADELASQVWRICNRPVHSMTFEQAPPSLAERVRRDGVPL